MPSSRYLERPALHMPPVANTPYIAGVVIMVTIAVVAIAAIAIFRPDRDNTVLTTTIVGFIGTSTLSLLTLLKTNDTHRSVNGRLEEFLTSTRFAAHAAGMLEAHETDTQPIMATMAQIHQAIANHDEWERAAIERRRQILQPPADTGERRRTTGSPPATPPEAA